MIKEVLPSLMQVLQQPLRPVALHLFSPQEKALLAALVATLVAYAITYDVAQAGQLLVPGGTQLTPLVPAVHTLCAFPVCPKNHCSCLSVYDVTTMLLKTVSH